MRGLSSVTWLKVVIVKLLLVACSGGGEQTAAHEASAHDTGSGYKLEIALFDANTAAPTTSISTSSPAQILVNVSRFGNPAESQLVSISSDLGSVGVTNGTLLTDANGQARVNLLADGLDGAGTISASIEVDDTRITARLNFSSSGGEASQADTLAINLALLSESGASNSVRADDPGTLSILVSDQNGGPQANVLVNLSGNLVSFNPPAATVLTDDNGRASIQVLGGDIAGIATLLAMIGEGEGTVSQSLNIAVEPPAIKLGSGFGDEFSEGQLVAGLSAVSAGGTVSISAAVVNPDNSAFRSPLNIAFSSPCVQQQLATIDQQVSSVEGLATATYRADGCVGSDTVTATLSFSGSQFVASVELSILSDEAGSIVFQDASPTTIVFRGSGGQGLQESSTVRFQVFGAQGLPLANQRVDFALTTEVGGITLSPAFAFSDAQGFVSTSVQSGNVATSVVVIASISDGGVSSQSASLVISTGVPDQDSVSLSLNQCSPEGWQHDGQEVTVTVRAADFFNNLVPDGVSFAFSTEGGSIEPSCTSVGGSCSVTWVSQNPRPENGRSTVLVSAIGSESFQDENGSGRFDDGDGFSDIGEAFRDDNLDGVRDIAEPYIDFNRNGLFDGPDGLFGGPLCEDSVRCSANAGVTVRDAVNLVMAGSRANFSFDPPFGSNYASKDTIVMTVSDLNNNAMPSGSTISLEASVGTLISRTDYLLDNCQRNPTTHNIIIDLDDADPPSGRGFLSILVITPLGIESGFSYEFNY